MRKPRSSFYGRYIHQHTRADGRVCWVVAEQGDNGQYRMPMSEKTAELTGCYAWFGGLDYLAAIESWPTRRQALRRARYLYAEDKTR